MMLTRRGLITGLLGALATPAIVRADNLMRVRGIIVPPPAYCFSAWVKAEDAPVAVEVAVNGVVAKTVFVKYEWTRIKVDVPGLTPPAIGMNCRGASVYAAQLGKTV